MKKLIALLLAACLMLGLMTTAFAADEKSNDIVILYTNDVHCAVDDNIGYAGLAAYKKEMQAAYNYVALVDCGDSVQGDVIGTLSKGEYLVDIMNEVGYDFAAFGNHEFDYTLPQLQKLIDKAKYQYLCCNLTYTGKDGKGLLPDSVIYSTDLHSLGQFVQDGSNVLFETVVKFQKPQREIFIEEEQENGDGLNFLAGKPMSFINEKAFEGTVLAHTDGNTPNLVLEVPAMNEAELGYLIYFFEKACAVSGYMLGVNPFDQPGVESYKKNMFALLGKPGYEDAKAALEARLGK